MCTVHEVFVSCTPEEGIGVKRLLVLLLFLGLGPESRDKRSRRTNDPEVRPGTASVPTRRTRPERHVQTVHTVRYRREPRGRSSRRSPVPPGSTWFRGPELRRHQCPDVSSVCVGVRRGATYVLSRLTSSLSPRKK